MAYSDFFDVRIAHKTLEALGIFSFELVACDGGDLPPFSPGSHIDVRLPTGLIRQYSLCNSPLERNRYLICVLKDECSRGGSAAMHENISENDILQISMPKNYFPLAQAKERSLLLAGGIGITPILCMAEHLAASGANFELHYCARTQERTAFFEYLSQSAFKASVQFHMDDEAKEKKLDLSVLLATPHKDIHLYVCGPKGFIGAVLDQARMHGWAEEQLHFEFFGGAAIGTIDSVFDVKIASTGEIINIPSELTVVDALGRVGIEIPTSCGQGVCGTCLTRVLEGIPDHRDSYLSPEEQARNDEFTPCCSRSKSPLLVLDL